MTTHGQGQEFISLPASSDEIWPLLTPPPQSTQVQWGLPGNKGAKPWIRPPISSWYRVQAFSD